MGSRPAPDPVPLAAVADASELTRDVFGCEMEGDRITHANLSRLVATAGEVTAALHELRNGMDLHGHLEGITLKQCSRR